jgi:hypothetical protein
MGKHKTHFAEIFAKKSIEVIPNTVQMADELRSRRAEFGDNWPEWCYIPSQAVIEMISNHFNGSQYHQRLEHVRHSTCLAASLRWMKNRTIYLVDDELSAELSSQPLDGNIPVQALQHLPYHCVYIECDVRVDGLDTIGFFAWLDWNVFTKTQELHFLFLSHSDEIVYNIVPLVGTLHESLKYFFIDVINGIKNMPRNLRHEDAVEFGHQFKIPTFAKEINRMSPDRIEQIAEQLLRETASDLLAPMTVCINHLLYLCSEEPDIPNAVELRTRRTYDSTGVPKRTATLEVGTRIGAALRMAARPQPAADKTTDQRNPQSRCSPIAHMRRAHWQHYWIGPKDGERVLKLIWKSPVPVNIHNNELTSVLRAVQG